MTRCNHSKWRKYGGPNDGCQQWVCTRCGRLKIRRIRFCHHRWKWDRRMGFGTLKCRKCRKEKRVR